MSTGLAVLTLLLTIADHWTTYLCLRAPVQGWSVREANPVADWLFAQTGLVPGLLIDSAITLAAVVFLMTTARLPEPARMLCFVLIAGSTAWAVHNNLSALESLGLSPLALGTI